MGGCQLSLLGVTTQHWWLGGGSFVWILPVIDECQQSWLGVSSHNFVSSDGCVSAVMAMCQWS